MTYPRPFSEKYQNQNSNRNFAYLFIFPHLDNVVIVVVFYISTNIHLQLC